ncbi:MAG: cytochrome b/b6 domain-containing protein [Rhizobiaceae bacterium]|nr:cytochrome b/b6 domain-containing protein [Rhizobiaceae bacterium]
MPAREVKGYSTTQIALHWAVVVLVSFQFVAHDGIEDAWRALVGERQSGAGVEPVAYLHIAAGTLILVLALARIYLRWTRGAPSPPSDEPRILQIAAEGIHGLIYLLLLLLPVSGLIAWFLVVESAAVVHEWMQTILLFAIALHVGGALFQHFVRRSDVLMRMFRPEHT